MTHESACFTYHTCFFLGSLPAVTSGLCTSICPPVSRCHQKHGCMGHPVTDQRMMVHPRQPVSPFWSSKHNSVEPVEILLLWAVIVSMFALHLWWFLKFESHLLSGEQPINQAVFLTNLADLSRESSALWDSESRGNGDVEINMYRDIIYIYTFMHIYIYIYAYVYIYIYLFLYILSNIMISIHIRYMYQIFFCNII